MNRFAIGLLPAVALVLVACRPEPADSAVELLTARTMGLAHLQRDQLVEAEGEFRKVIRLAPDEPLGYANLGIVYLRLGKLEQAEAQARRALARDSSDPNLKLILARIQESAGRPEAARATLQRLLQGDPANAKALYGLAELAQTFPDPADRPAREYLERLAGLLPANLAIRLRFADALLQSGDADAALRELEAVRQLPPEPPREAKPFLEPAIRALRASPPRLAPAAAALARFHRFLEVTPAYQAGLQAIRGPGGEGALAGLAVLTFTPRFEILERLGQDQRATREAVRFEDVTARSGLEDALTRQGDTRAALGRTAVAVGDFDGDGVDDLFLSRRQPDRTRTGAVYRRGAGRFQSMASPAGPLPGATAAAAGDYDNDGHLDLLLVDEAGRVRLWHNTGRDAGAFREPAGGGLDPIPPARKAVFVDLDHDGDLDLVAATEVGARIYRNNLDGTFQDMVPQGGVPGGSDPIGDVAFGDFDNDGRIDLLLARATGDLALLRNTGPGRFEDVTIAAGLATATGAGAVAVGDYDNDGSLDLFTAGGGAGPVLYRNEGAGRFGPDGPSSRAMRELRSLTAGAALFLDYDNDGFLDLAVVGEPREDGAGAFLFRNDGTGRFEDRSSILPVEVREAREVVAWDADLDGDLDLLVTAPDEGPRLLRNDGGNLNFYVRVELTGLRTGSGKNNQQGIGARLELRAGELYQSRVVTGRVTHFGLGRHLKADVLRVEWPNGVPQAVYLPGSDQDVLEEQVLKGSCAFVYAWDGHGFRFVTDVMWRSA
ncbi:MAG TPA: FG-GAP-like repeat-containing protein, partial [Gemmatimonadales bacterium]|nr:FG-GAP-like repeat-containing protein [Gemmatimonadales bacterium]